MISQDGPPREKIDIAAIPNAVPEVLPKSALGNPPSYIVDGRTYYVKSSAKGFDERGIASWYGTKFDGQRTSSGERYNLAAMTAAMKTLPLPTFVQVTNLQNHKQIIVKVNDRGPFKENRIIDLSYVAAAKLGMLPKGTALVEVRAIDPYTWNERLENKPALPPLEYAGRPLLYLQVGAYAERNNAEQELRRLRNVVHQPSRIEANHQRGYLLYRVQVGPLANVDASDLLVRRLEETGFSNPVTVIE